MSALPSLNTGEGRRFWSFIVVLGSCFVFTTFAAVGVWLVSGNPYYSLILALAAHVQLFVGLATFSFVLGRRVTLEVSAGGAKFGETGQHVEDIKAAIQAPATAAQDAADAVIEEVTSGEKG